MIGKSKTINHGFTRMHTDFAQLSIVLWPCLNGHSGWVVDRLFSCELEKELFMVRHRGARLLGGRVFSDHRECLQCGKEKR